MIRKAWAALPSHLDHRSMYEARSEWRRRWIAPNAYLVQYADSSAGHLRDAVRQRELSRRRDGERHRPSDRSEIRDDKRVFGR